jgi:hypothetical protein
MKDLIEKRIAELTEEKKEILNDYIEQTDPEIHASLAMANMRIGMELIFLNKLSKAFVSGRSEQLKAFLDWRDKQNILTLHDYDNDELIRCYEKNL